MSRSAQPIVIEPMMQRQDTRRTWKLVPGLGTSSLKERRQILVSPQRFPTENDAIQGAQRAFFPEGEVDGDI